MFYNKVKIIQGTSQACTLGLFSKTCASAVLGINDASNIKQPYPYAPNITSPAIMKIALDNLRKGGH